jgi:hypothetical protein
MLVLTWGGAGQAALIDGLISYWSFEDAGNLGADLAGSYDGTLMGGILPTQIPGMVGSAIDLERNNGNYIDIPDGFADFTGGITVAAWVYTESYTNWARVMDFGNGAGVHNVLLARVSTGDALRWQTNGGIPPGGDNLGNTPNVFDLNEWQFIVATIDNDAAHTARVYLGDLNAGAGGTPQLAQVASGTVRLPANVIRTRNYIGESNWGGDDFWDGAMDEVGIWGRALSLAEVQQLWNGGIGIAVVPPPAGTLTWDGVGNGNWGDPNWVTPPPAVPDATIVANVGPLGTNNTVTVASSQAAYGLNVTNGGTVAVGAGNTLTVFKNIDAAGGTIAMGHGSTLVTQFGGGTIGTLTTAGDATLDIAGDVSVAGATYDDQGVAGTLTKRGPGVLSLDNRSGTGVLAAATTFRVETGTLRAEGSDPLGGAANVVLAGGTLSVGDIPSGRQLHLDASSISGLADGATVSFWSDISGQGHHADGVSGDPSYVAVGPNGQPVVNFDGNDGLFTSYNFDSLSEYTVLSVARYTGGDNERIISSKSRNWLFGFHGNLDERWYAEGWIHTTGTSNTNWHLHAGTMTSDTDPRAAFWKEGNLLTSNDTGSNNTNYKPGRISLGGWISSEFSRAEVAELLIFDRVLSATELNNVGGYLADKYGIATTYTGAMTAHLDMTGTDITVEASSTLHADAVTAGFGSLTLQDGSLTTAGAGRITFTDTTIAGPNVGITTQSTTLTGPVDGSGLTAAFVKTGPADLILDQPGVGLDNVTFDVQEGRLIGVHGSNPFAAATMNIGGGELALGTGGGSVTYDNQINATGGTLSAGAVGGGVGGPATITVGSATNSLNVAPGSLLRVQATDGLALEIAGQTLGGSFSFEQGSIDINGGGVVKRIEVGSATVNIPNITINDQAKLGDVLITANAGSFDLGGSDLGDPLAPKGITLGTGDYSIGLDPIAPGVWYGTVPGNINTTTPNPMSFLTFDLAETENGIAGNTTEIYTGYFYEDDGHVAFTEDIDDRTRLWIDGSLVIGSDNWRDRISTADLGLTRGWHEFELRISNGGGGSGPHTRPGFGYDPTGGSAWVHPSDPALWGHMRTAADPFSLPQTDLLVTGDAVLNVVSDTTAALGSIVLQAGSSLTLSGAPDGIAVDGVSGNGTVNVLAPSDLLVGGEFHSGDSPGTILLDGNVTFLPGSIFSVDVEGTGPGQYSQAVLLGGTLDITNAFLEVDTVFSHSFRPGDTITLIDNQGGVILGSFLPGTEIIDQNGAYHWEVVYADGSVFLENTVIPEPATLCLLGLGLLAARRRRKH